MAITARLASWFDEIWPRLAVASGVGYLATAYAVSRWLTRRSPARLAIPSEFRSYAVESLSCRTEDGMVLKGWAIEPPRPRATIVLFHGLRRNRSFMIPRIEFLTASGYRCVAFDHRAHGESGGRWTSFGYFERRDVAAIAELARARWPNEPCAAQGISMGGAALCFAGANCHAFDAIILESVYHELASAFQHRVGCGFPSWFKHFRKGIIRLTERRFGVRIGQVSPLAHIAALAPRPLLLLTGSNDPHAPPHEVQLLADQVRATGRFHVIPAAGHENVCDVGGDAYRALILSFLDRQLYQRSQTQAA